MAIMPGVYEGVIKNNTVRSINGKEYVLLTVEVSDQFGESSTVPTKIWLTEKAANMARAALKKCGFDPDCDDLELLTTNGILLSGRCVPVTVEDNGKYGLQGSINLDNVSKSQLRTLTQRLRDAGGDGEPDVEPPPAKAPMSRKELHAKHTAESIAAGGPDDIPFSWLLPLLVGFASCVMALA